MLVVVGCKMLRLVFRVLIESSYVFVCYCVGVIIIIFVHVFDMLVSYVNVILFLHARCGYFASTLLAYESALETRDLRLELQE